MAKRRANLQPATQTEPKSVDIRKASNGFVVSQWGPNGSKCYVAKTEIEAQKIAQKLLK